MAFEPPNWKEEIATADGSPAKVLSDNLKGEYPVAVAITSSGSDVIYRYRLDGTGMMGVGAPRIVNVKPVVGDDLWLAVAMDAVKHPMFIIAYTEKELRSVPGLVSFAKLPLKKVG